MDQRRIEDLTCIHMCTSTEESKRRAPGLEDMQRLKEEHALQMSLLLAEQEEEQRHFRLVSTWN